jgi:hypothetical protein
MKNTFTKLLICLCLISSLFSVGCATGLNSSQKREFKSYKAKGLEVREKSPGTGAALGILPGGGSFYSRSYGTGVANLIFWPLSVLWDPVSGYQGAVAINYYATKETAEKQYKKEINSIDEKLAINQMSPGEYLKEKHIIENKYQP